MAEYDINQLKGELLSLIMSSPKDITPDGEEALLYLKRNFNKIWEHLWQAVVDKYKYTMIANDAEFEPNSRVQKQWNDEISELERLKEGDLKQEKIFNGHEDLLKGEIDIQSDLTIKDKENLLKEVERQKEQAHKFRYN